MIEKSYISLEFNDNNDNNNNIIKQSVILFFGKRIELSNDIVNKILKKKI